jgi:hypothetical protein
MALCVTCTGNSKVNVKLSLYLTNQALRNKELWGSGCIDPGFLDLGTRCK